MVMMVFAINLPIDVVITTDFLSSSIYVFRIDDTGEREEVEDCPIRGNSMMLLMH